MRVEFCFSNDHFDLYQLSYWTDLPIIPPVGQGVYVRDFLNEKDLNKLEDTSSCWSRNEALVIQTCLRKDDKGWYYWVWLECEDW